jgi:hypothetical protein
MSTGTKPAVQQDEQSWRAGYDGNVLILLFVSLNSKTKFITIHK